MKKKAQTPAKKLTAREKEILIWSAHGKTYGEIASLLAIQEDTVKGHIENVRHKLNATNKTHVIAIAISDGHIKL